MKRRHIIEKRVTRFALEGDRVVVGKNAAADVGLWFEFHPLLKSNIDHSISFVTARRDGAVTAPIGLALPVMLIDFSDEGFRDSTRDYQSRVNAYLEAEWR